MDASKAADRGRYFPAVRDIHFRVSDTMYRRLSEEAKAAGTTPSNFCREAALVRGAMSAARRDVRWAESEVWVKISRLVGDMDRVDAQVRDALAKRRKRS